MVRVMIRPRKVAQFLSQLDMCQVMNDKCMTMGENISLSLTTHHTKIYANFGGSNIPLFLLYRRFKKWKTSLSVYSSYI